MAVVSPVDIGRLLRELQAVDEQLLQLGLREPGTSVSLPKLSQLLEQTVQLNNLNLLQQTDRQRLQTFLAAVKEQAPLLHISFSSDPSPAFMEKLMAWLRREINPLVLVTVGLQPNLAAGCVVRSTNKYFDFSLRANLAKNREAMIAELMKSLAPPAAPDAPADQVVASAPVPAAAPAPASAADKVAA
jgi:F0F1-type ATP synthase delta subunit